MPKFSVVISVYNKAYFIQKTIQSVLEQTEDDYEIIIVNDASTDHSEEAIQAIHSSKIKYHSFEQNKGAAAARNQGIALASGQFIALLDADDIWDRNYLKEQSQLIYKYPNESVFSCAICIEKGNKKIKKQYSIPQHKEGIYNYFIASMKTSILHSSSTILKKEVFNTTGYYNTSIKSGQDTDLYIRIGLNYAIVFNPSMLVTYTINQGSLWRSIKSVSDRAQFDEYTDLEKENPELKRFMDINRFSLALQAKCWNEMSYFKKYKNQIDPSNLNKKQLFLIKQNRYVLLFLFKTKKILEKLGLSFTVFG